MLQFFHYGNGLRAFFFAFTTFVTGVTLVDVFQHSTWKSSFTPKDPHTLNVHDPGDVDLFGAGFTIFTPHTEGGSLVFTISKPQPASPIRFTALRLPLHGFI